MRRNLVTLGLELLDDLKREQ